MELDLVNDIRPISDIRTNVTALIQQVREGKRPLVITQNGRSVAVLMDVEKYQRLYEERELFKAVAQGEQDIVEGNITHYKEVMKALKERLQ